VEVRLEGLAVGLDERFRQKLGCPLPPLAVGGNGLVKEDAAVILLADGGRGLVPDVVVAHAACEVTLVFRRLGACLQLFP
jgi:hypothetical protein